MKNNIVLDEEFFNDDGNWKNSEVMREFVRKLDGLIASASVEPYNKTLSSEAEFDVGSYLENNSLDQLEGFESKARELVVSELKNVVKELQKIANKNYIDYGSESAFYEVELAIEKIKSILNTEGE